MLKAFYSSATGMRAQELMIDNTANNLANVNTTGFKKKHINFADLLYDTKTPPGAASANGEIKPIGLQIGSGVRAVGTTSLFAQGTPTETGIDTHMAIEGDGFFKVTQGNTIAYTRDGNFTLNDQGQMVTGDGFLLDPQITIPQQATNLSISSTGVVSYQIDGVSTVGPTIQLARFTNPAGLQNLGSNLYMETAASGAEILGQPGQQGNGQIRQRFIEGSNVEVVSELVSLITAQRAYEINSRAIRAGDEMLSSASDLVR
ncbi:MULTISPECIES: flagellar basal-body rod protein FlgG [Pirellulaceae]|uniref:Flagellar basal-body rod protein FlgG n=1 Tax=Stieleria magnilauensis TaxID=2527963 RepID=A0ABX5XHT7_9BACT|nr:flagellar basal-body rod protein FlgG [Rhodopirellula sp. SM50]MDV6030937.1 flagellar basal-body rod protein FlgG [Phycisphaera sp. RhM]PAY18232.1 flagellar basal-body rod protein FlgG [Rhodopirellula sp. SM50]QDV81553.1 Flagellar basal-body rod protein FlgG [Planctomycetes bacterium TBK1r]